MINFGAQKLGNVLLFKSFENILLKTIELGFHSDKDIKYYSRNTIQTNMK